MNSTTIMILAMLITFTLIVLFYISKKNNMQKVKKETTEKLASKIKQKLAKNNKKVEKSLSVTELTAPKNTKIAVSKTTNYGKKPANWTETTSYEDDIRSLDIDAILKNVKSGTTNIELMMGEPIDNNKKPLVLLVDDSMVVRKYVGDLLKKNNYELVIKNDGVEALSYLKSVTKKPELIISDIEMPNMNGIELIEEIRSEKRFNSVPILVISAHAASHLKLMENESIQGFIKKPFEDVDLVSQSSYLVNNF